MTSRPFADRHIGPDDEALRRMLDVVGIDSLEALVDAAVPSTIRQDAPLDLPAALSEEEALGELRSIAAENEVMTSLIGMGYVGTVLPGVIQRNVLENPAWYTSYTPYQPEISQGRLEALLNFQTMVADLTGMDLANASLLDEGTAAAEAMTMCRRVGRHPGTAFFVDAAAHPQTIDVVRTRAEPLGIELIVGDPETDLDPEVAFGVLVQDPATDGRLRDLAAIAERVHAAGGLLVVAADLLACTLVVPPGEHGADIVVGSAQRFGVPMGYGGPHAAFMATRSTYARALPGRLVGVSVDTEGRTALRLALQTREQHIRREKATSNICTAQVLLANIAGFYATYHGPDGLRAIAERVHRLTTGAADALASMGVAVRSREVFDTLVLDVPGAGDAVVAAGHERRLNLRPLGPDAVGLTFDETTTPEVVARVLDAVAAATGASGAAASTVGVEGEWGIPEGLRRTSSYLDHPVFHRHRSETSMLRYLRRLADADLALDRTMIPLGSCTMKLNATAEMAPITWPELAHLHPFAPVEQARGYRRIIGDLEAWLAEISGYDAVSMQPNAGSQGEYAGLLAIRAYHRSRGDEGRTVCLIPSSAHGTNAASAVLAGMDVVVVGCDDDGNIDVDDLRAKIDRHGAELAALMITYPSTHGVYESTVREVCDLVHSHGGQVYLDGANLNALVGIGQPGRFGADVSHFNLHKTFCIPHGGGGPGVGPIGVRSHLAPFLPGHGVVPPHDGPAPGEGGVGPVASAPWGSASILPISWMYVRMMGAEGLLRATQVAILSANYVARVLAPHYPVLYAGPEGFVAHECILDTRPLKDEAGVSVDDIAKRLMDHGFHAPTMSFPVAGTLMIEPTESEDLDELDRFCDAMASIRGEIEAVAKGDLPRDDNPLVRAPHTAADLLGAWERAYDRQAGAFPDGVDPARKYWPPVSRIDQAHGDRNVMCSCPPIEAYGR
ncbi:aminomethyl-transferring glycine dehydrogenase [Actinomarinicola tropica]|uniref:Glycine dehydrogenase (decarboxylating) n=1 Tax=Actinomarinicola tropica TaxID=2789776 RepID=A0A5Q2RQN8_9ACTN|nr:aminomethyl-transferring glycine dehydrogenase [Actinomarinicola tropica]QGG96210.1 aminomethyl-transferring glycine dehydrogenase [Actinomarinicola tropica]